MRWPARHVSTLVLLLSALLFAAFGFFFFRDNFATHYPVKAITAAAFAAGEIPWWNYHENGGQPLAGNPNTLTFYPDNVLLLLVPVHVAFNLHFLIHLAGGFLAVRALCRERGTTPRVAAVSALIYTLSGAAISATAFYNLITAVALVPLALLGAERRSPRIVGMAFGLMLLAAEPVMIGSAVVAVVIVGWRRLALRDCALAVALAAAIGSPQLIAYSEIAGEVERASAFSARTVLATSLTPLRVAEIFTWPLSGFLNDTGGNRGRLFSTIFIGIIALPSLFRRSRYTLLAVLMLAMAIGRYNPLLAWAVEQFETVRIMRFPEKFALPLTVAMAILIADLLQRSSMRRTWTLITVLPLLFVAARARPVDWFAPYRVEPHSSRRVHAMSVLRAGDVDARREYRLRARRLEPLFGAVAGVRYALGRSADGMHAQLSRIVVDRFAVAPPEARLRYLRVAGVAMPGALPDALVMPRAAAAASVADAVRFVETAPVDLSTTAVAPISVESAAGRVVGYAERGQKIVIDVAAAGPVLLFVNQTYFSAWTARLGDEELTTLPVDVDRLGVLVPRGGRVELTFGKRRGLTALAWLASIALLIGSAFASRVEKRHRRASEIE